MRSFSSWSPTFKLEAIQSSNEEAVHYVGLQDLLLTLDDGRVRIVHVPSSQMVGSIGVKGDVIQTYSYIKECSYLIASCRSTLIRVWKVRLDHVELSGFAQTCDFSVDLPESKVDAESSRAAVTVVKSWKGPEMLASAIATSLHEAQTISCAIGTVDGSVFVYDVNEGRLTHQFKSLSVRITTLIFASKQHRLLVAASSLSPDVYVYDLWRRTTLARLQDHLSGVNAVASVLLKGDSSSGDLLTLVTAGIDKVINIWSIGTLNKLIAKHLLKVAGLRKDLDMIIQAGIQPNAEELGCIRTIEKRERISKKKRTRDGFKDATYTCHDISPILQLTADRALECLTCFPSTYVESLPSNCSFASAKDLHQACSWLIASGCDQGIITFWTHTIKKKVWEFTHPALDSQAISAIKLTKATKANYLLAAGANRNIVIWELSDCSVAHVLIGNANEMIHCQLVHIPFQHRQLYESNPSSTKPEWGLLNLASTSTFTFYEAHDKKLMPHIYGSAEHETVLSLDCSPDGCWAASGYKDGSVRLWSILNRRQVASVGGHSAPVIALAFNKKKSSKIECSCMAAKNMALPADPMKGGCFVITGCSEGVLKFWILDRNALKSNLDVSPSQSQLDSSGVENVLNLPMPDARANAHKSGINAIAVSLNDQLAVTASNDKTLKLWRLPSLNLMGTFAGHSRHIWTVSFSPVEKIIASGSADHTVKLWNIADFSCLKTFQAHTGSILSLGFLKKGTQVASASADGLVRVWDIRTSECSSTLDGHQGKKVWALTTRPDQEDLMVTCGADNVIIFWKDTGKTKEEMEVQLKQEEAEKLAAITALSESGQSLKALSSLLELKQPFLARKIFQQSYLKAAFDSVDERCLTTQKNEYSEYFNSRRLRVTEISDADLQEWISKLDSSELKTLLEFIAQWNADKSSAFCANFVMTATLKTLRLSKLMAIEGFSDFIKTYTSYNQRHISRLNGLIQKSFVIDMVLLNSGLKSLDKASASSRSQGLKKLSPPEILSSQDIASILFD